MIRNRLYITNRKLLNIFLFLIVFLVTSFILFSSLFSNLQGFTDAFAAIPGYIEKSGNNTKHIWPWYYYFQIIGFNILDGQYLSEALILLLALIGMIFSLTGGRQTRRDPFFLFLTYFTLIAAVIYSAIPYKTPWSMLTFWQGIVLLSAYGIVQLFSRINTRSIRIWGTILLTIGILHLFYQVYLTSFKYSADPANPYTYSHPENDVKEISGLLNRITSNVPENIDIYINVAMPGNDYWPLPWYIRQYQHVAWEDTIRRDISKFNIILSSPDFDSDLVKYLYEIPPPGERNLYIPLFENMEELRPGIEISGYIQKDLYDEFIQ